MREGFPACAPGMPRRLRRVTAPIDALTFRTATTADADALAAVMAEGIGTYRSFAGAGFRPLAAAEIAATLTPRLGLPEVWCRVALDDEAVAGYVSLLPAADAARPSAEPGLMHFWMLFVRPPWWGTGLAARLNADAVAEAHARGFTALRLFTPAAQARARAFYEREGWSVVGAPFPHDALGIDMVEYRRPLP